MLLPPGAHLGCFPSQVIGLHDGQSVLTGTPVDVDLGSHFFSSNPEHLRTCGSWWHACPPVLGLSKALQGGPQTPPVSSEVGAGECSPGRVGRETLAGERGGLCLGSQAGDGSRQEGTGGAQGGWWWRAPCDPNLGRCPHPHPRELECPCVQEPRPPSLAPLYPDLSTWR